MENGKIEIKLNAYIYLSNNNYQQIVFYLIYESETELELYGTTNKIRVAFEDYRKLYPKTAKSKIGFNYTYN